MSGSHIRLYKAEAEADCAFFLEKGSVFFYCSPVDKYAIRGTKLILGATELILKNFRDQSLNRIETAIASSDSSIKKICSANFISSMGTYSFAFNVSRVLAKQVMLTNMILTQNMKQLSGQNHELRDLCITYYKMILAVRENYEKLRFPWLKEILDSFSTSLVYSRGEAYYRSCEPARIDNIEKLSETSVEYPRGSVICEENSIGEEMYVLQSGSIDVSIHGDSVATIEEPGVVFGEMALLLGEKRTATLKAKNNAVLSTIRKENLKDLAHGDPSFLKSIAISLAERHYYNTIKIDSTNREIAEKSISEDKSEALKNQSLTSKARKELSNLTGEIEKLQIKRKENFLREILGINPGL